MKVATDTVYGPQWTHPHPSFSRDERLVAFASDRTGHPHVYVAIISGTGYETPKLSHDDPAGYDLGIS
jgi:Tol biopolymer transport system component